MTEFRHSATPDRLRFLNDHGDDKVPSLRDCFKVADHLIQIMKRRTLLKGQLAEAWTHCIEHDYEIGLINGERALQACLFHRLMTIFEFEMPGRRCILIEPTISIGEREHRMPDMVICDRDSVIALVELKFHPRVTLSGKTGMQLAKGAGKDLETLIAIASDLKRLESAEGSGRLPIVVNNTRYLGASSGRKTSYGLAKNVLLVWAGVYKRSEGSGAEATERLANVFKDKEVTVKGGLLELHARTNSGSAPACTSSFSGWQKNGQAETVVA